MSKLGSDLIEGLTEAVAFARGDAAGSVVHVVDVSDICADRLKLRRRKWKP